MTWLFILLDILILAGIIVLCIFVVRLWNRNRPLSKSSLSEFRNDDIYEKSVQDKKRLAHIEDSLEDVQFVDTEESMDAEELMIEEDNITFSAGYGGMTELGDE